MDWHSNKGKSKLIRELMEKGFSVRKSEKAVNAVFGCMTQALWTGEVVEIPGGSIVKTIRKGKPRQKLQKFRNVNTGKVRYKTVRLPGTHMSVKFRPDVTLDLSPLPVPPPPEPPEVTEVRHLATELLGLSKPADDQTLATLQKAVDLHPHQPGALLRRLQEAKRRGWLATSVSELADHVKFLWWM